VGNPTYGCLKQRKVTMEYILIIINSAIVMGCSMLAGYAWANHEVMDRKEKIWSLIILASIIQALLILFALDFY
jgi:uncharacterized membrane-anchored protein